MLDGKKIQRLIRKHIMKRNVTDFFHRETLKTNAFQKKRIMHENSNDTQNRSKFKLTNLFAFEQQNNLSTENCFLDLWKVEQKYLRSNKNSNFWWVTLTLNISRPHIDQISLYLTSYFRRRLRCNDTSEFHSVQLLFYEEAHSHDERKSVDELDGVHNLSYAGDVSFSRVWV